MVSELDTGVGQIVDALEREGIRENTLLIFMSDNGGLSPQAVSENARGWSERLQRWFGAPLSIPILEFMRGLSLDGGGDNTPFRRGKSSVYEGGVRVPGLVSWPGAFESNPVSTIVAIEDILPTLADLFEFEAAPGAPFDGASQLDALSGHKPLPRPGFLTRGRSGDEAWYDFPWKLVVPVKGSPELYRLDIDPTEMNDLSVQEPDRLERMLDAHSAQPRGPLIDPPFYKFILDPDRFGGEENREPWADTVERPSARPDEAVRN
jgi:arylsulfatase A-like enzyme